MLLPAPLSPEERTNIAKQIINRTPPSTLQEIEQQTTLALSVGSAGNKGSSLKDEDQDGLDDHLEQTLADGFMPIYHVSAGENSGTGFALLVDQPTLAVKQLLPASSPVVHWRVTPHSVANFNGVPHQFVRVDYLTIWNRDDGLTISNSCQISASILGGFTGYNLTQIINGLGDHGFDQERSAALLAAPLNNADRAKHRTGTIQINWNLKIKHTISGIKLG